MPEDQLKIGMVVGAAAGAAGGSLTDVGIDYLERTRRILADVEDRFYHARAATAGSWPSKK